MTWSPVQLRPRLPVRDGTVTAEPVVPCAAAQYCAQTLANLLPARDDLMNRLPVGKAISYAYAFTFNQLGTIIGLCWVPLVLMAFVQFLPFAFGNPMAPAENATA